MGSHVLKNINYKILRSCLWYNSFSKQLLKTEIIYSNFNSNSFISNNKLNRIQSNQRNYFTATKLLSTLQFKLADIGEGIAEVNIKEWYVKVGDKVKQFDRICEVQSDKATVTISSRYDGIISKLHYKVDDVAFVGKPLVDIETENQNDSIPEALHIEDSVEKTSDRSLQEFKINKVLATPAVRKLALDNKVNITEVQGSGKDGRILKDDIISHLKEKQELANEKTTLRKVNVKSVTNANIQNDFNQTNGITTTIIKRLETDKKEQIKGMKKVMVKTMSQANLIPHFSYCDEYDMSALVSLKKDLKSYGEKKDINISYLPIIIKICSIALHSYPIINSTVDEKCDYITYKSSHNIGIAMDTNDGLIVPNIKNVESKTVLDIAKELNRLQYLGVNSKLSPTDLTGGTLTLSNIGTIGGTYMKAVILPPEVAICAFGKIQRLPRYDENRQIVARDLIQASWSADHRIIDGATMARFSNLIKSYLENPAILLMELK